jgi:hypothetical protein
MKHQNRVGLVWAVAVLGLAMAAAVAAQQATTNLGNVTLRQAVRADGKPLPSGTYQVRITTEEAQPAAAGQTPNLERWAEFLQGGQVRGREVVTVVPSADLKEIAEGTPPPNGGYKVEMLKGNDYLRVWFNRGAQHYLIHFAL